MVSKRASNKAIGARAEAQFKDVLHAWSFVDEQIEKARPTYKPIGGGRMISSPNDFYSLFDFMVKNKDFTMYIQVKAGEYAGTNVSHAKKDILEWCDKYAMDTDKIMIAQKVDRKGFILRTYIDSIEKKEYINFKGVTIDTFK